MPGAGCKWFAFGTLPTRAGTLSALNLRAFTLPEYGHCHVPEGHLNRGLRFIDGHLKGMHIRAFVQNVLGDTHGKSLNQIEGLPHNMRADNLGNFRIVRGLGEVVGCSSLREVGV